MRPLFLRRSLLPATLFLAVVASAFGAETKAPELAEPLGRASESVVSVETVFHPQGAPLRLDAEEATFCNTGFFVGSQGEVLTCLLGLVGCREITVATSDGRRVPARVVAIDQPSGLALLKTELDGTAPLEPVEEPPALGSWILLASARRPGGTSGAVLTPGLVSAHGASVRLQGVDWEGLMVASVNACPGCAAAPLLDPRGRLVGVVLGVAWPRGRAVGTGECLVLPAHALAPILSRLREGRSCRLGWLGVTIVQEPGEREGVGVTAVLESSPAHAAGVRAGDVLLQVGEHTIDSPAVLARHVVQAGPGRKVELRLLRGDEIKTVPVEVGARPLLICGGSRRPGEELVRLRWRRSVGAFAASDVAPWSRETLAELVEENDRLLQHVRSLEERVRRLEGQED